MGGRGTSPPEFGAGDANANCPPQILSYRCTERSVLWPSNMPESIFGRGSAPDPAGGAHNAPQTPSRLGSGRPSLNPTPLDTNPLSALTMRPPRIPARSMPIYGRVVLESGWSSIRHSQVVRISIPRCILYGRHCICHNVP